MQEERTSDASAGHSIQDFFAFTQTTTTTPPQLFLPSEQSRAAGPQPIEFRSSFFNYYYFQVIGAFQSFEFRRQDFLTFPSSLHKRVGSNLYKCKSPPGVQARFIMQFRFVFLFKFSLFLLLLFTPSHAAVARRGVVV
jgi:hypothetical protein